MCARIFAYIALGETLPRQPSTAPTRPHVARARDLPQAKAAPAARHTAQPWPHRLTAPLSNWWPFSDITTPLTIVAVTRRLRPRAAYTVGIGPAPCGVTLVQHGTA